MISDTPTPETGPRGRLPRGPGGAANANFLRHSGQTPTVATLQLTPSQRAAVFRLAAVLLDYPHQAWEEVLQEARLLCEQLPDQVATAFQDFIDWGEQAGRMGAEKAYVETFDQRRRCCLELTYYSTGDTRQRGVALSVFKDLYRGVGYELCGQELPDYLPNVLELAAKCGGEDAQLVNQVLSAHREGVEILHSALTSLSSPWTAVVAALRMALPPVDAQTQERITKLIRTGPPQELVGIEYPKTFVSLSPPLSTPPQTPVALAE